MKYNIYIVVYAGWLATSWVAFFPPPPISVCRPQSDRQVKHRSNVDLIAVVVEVGRSIPKNEKEKREKHPDHNQSSAMCRKSVSLRVAEI